VSRKNINVKTGRRKTRYVNEFVLTVQRERISFYCYPVLTNSRKRLQYRDTISVTTDETIRR